MTRNVVQNTRPSFRFLGEGSGDESTSVNIDINHMMGSSGTSFLHLLHTVRLNDSYGLRISPSYFRNSDPRSTLGLVWGLGIETTLIIDYMYVHLHFLLMVIRKGTIVNLSKHD